MDLSQIEIEKEVKIVFMGTPEFSVPILEGLLENYKVRAVVTQPDKLVGRDHHLAPSPVKELALKHTLLILQPQKVREQIDEILALEPDLILTCAYGQILPQALLDVPKYGCINVHASLLPRLRGGAPIHRAIIEGHRKTGITIMYMNAKMDEGDIITKEEVEITDTDTATSLHDKLKYLGRDLLLKTLPSILDGTASRVKQEASEATYGFVITREDEHLDFSQGKKQVYNKIRGLNAWPGAFCYLDGKIMKVWESEMTDAVYSNLLNGEITKLYENGIGVKVGNGEVILTMIQPEGKNKMKASDFLRGLPDKNILLGKVLN